MDTGEPMPGRTPQEVIKPKPLPGIEQLKKELTDPRTISKKLDPEGRSETAQTILETRTSARSIKEGIAGNEQKVQEIAELTSASYQQQRQKMGELTQRLESLVVRLRNAVGLGDKQVDILQDEIDAIKSERENLSTQSFAIEDELRSLKEKQTEIPNPKQLLEAYYEKVATQPLGNEQKRNLLKPEVLASLSTEEYIALWRRLNPYFLSHVTRQGFRDHYDMIYHTVGFEEFHNGFLDVMEDKGLLRPPMALRGLKARDEASVRQWMADLVLQARDETQAKEELNNLLHFSWASAPKYPDETAVHFATQIVADSYYGGEGNNEVFFVYPSDVLASQYAFAFNGWEKDFTKPQNETKWNDVFVWTDPNNPGVPVDSGIVFLPETTPVDPETGSKYASEIRVVDGQEKRVMVEDSALVGSFVKWGKKIDEQSLLKQALTQYKDEKNYYRQQDLKEDCFAAFVQELQGLGFATDASATLASKLIGQMHWTSSFDEEVLQGIAKESGAHWKRAENTISAKEYWEGFFAKNPDLRPKHIQYYDGDPTAAVLEFQQQNNIGRADTSKTEGQLLGFDDNFVLDMEKDPRANVGYDDLVGKADKIIKDHYGAKTPIQP